MTVSRVVCIVEGHGEVEATPIIIRRISQLIDPGSFVQIPSPIRVPKSKLLRSGELERAVELAAQKAGNRGGILILLDSDSDCPAHLGPQLLQRATTARSDIPISVVLAKWEFESWFIAAAESLRGLRNLAEDLAPPANIEDIQGAKEWLSKQMPSRLAYSETLDQPALASHFDFQAARHVDSFDKMYREEERLLQMR